MVVLCLLTSPLFGAITSVSPSVLPLGSEEFLTIQGTNLLGSVSTLVVYDGVLAFEPILGSPTALVAWVPVAVMIVPGTHTIQVQSNDGTSVRVHGPVSFTVEIPASVGPPLLGLPEHVIADASGPAGAVVYFTATAISMDGDPVAVSCTPSNGAQFPLGKTTVQCSATDSGGTSSGSFGVFVTDTTPPVLTVPAEIVTPNPVVTFAATAVDDIDGPLPVSCSPASGSTFPAGNTRVQCTAVDAHANSAVDFFMVRVQSGPVLSLPADMTVEATGPSGAIVAYEATAVGATSFSCSPPSGATFPLGDTTVTCTASSASGTTSGSFVVTVEDTTPPVLTLPSLVEEEATSPAGATVTFVATAYDLVDGDRPVDCVPASGSVFAIGTTSVSCTAGDTRGNGAGGTFDVTVADTTPPAITLVTASSTTIWPPNHKMVPITLTVLASDAVDPAPSVAIVSVSSNQPVNGTGDGDTAPDWQITGPLTVNLRAERAGTAERIYTIVVAVTDLYGNTATASVDVRVANARRRSVH